jgi:hypothetical protein
MVKKDFVKNLSLFFNGFIVATLFFGVLWADSNGVWTFAKDIRGGTFGSDEQANTNNFTFINPVYFREKILSLENPLTYYIDLSGRTQLNDLAVNKISSNELKIPYINNCFGKLYTDSTGKVVCGSDNVNDADNNPNNELQNLNSVLTIGNDGGGKRIINIANPVNAQDVATKNYVDNKIITPTINTRVSTFTKSAWRWPSGTAYCNSDEVVVGGGVQCTANDGWMFIAQSKPNGNGWYGSCDTPKEKTATIVVYAICLRK